MTRFVVDASAALKMAEEETRVSVGCELLAPTLLRSQTLSAPYGQVHAGKLPANAFVTLDEESARSVRELAPTATLDALR